MTEHTSPSFTRLAELASARVGGRAVAASDDFFASRHNLVAPAAPVFVADKYTSRGKWMDGWESRRRRQPGHDWCVVALGMRGIVRGVNVGTHFFTGNFPSHCSIEALDVPGALRPRLHAATGAPWTTILAQTALTGDADHYLAIDSEQPWTHLRLNIFPDGGVSRLRVYGEVAVPWQRLARRGGLIDLAALAHGGLALDASDTHYGHPNEMLMPGRARNMAEGWETRRRRGPGHDWAIIRLGRPGVIGKVEIDTNHYKGNYPDRASLEGRVADGSWAEILPESKLRPHHRHIFTRGLRETPAVSEVRLNIFPDGGVSRLRIYGRIARG